MTTRQTARQWIEMPLAEGGAAGMAARPKYPVDASALLVYRGQRVYVSFSGGTAGRADGRTLEHPDVRVLTSDEAQRLEGSFPVPLQAPRGHPHDEPLRLGDLVSRLTRRARIPECGACGRRKTALNAIVVWGWWRRPPRLPARGDVLPSADR